MLDITAEKTAGLARLLESAGKACIIVHTHPDGDALGSGVALKEYLRSRLHVQASLILPDAAPSTLGFLMKGETFTDASADPGAAAALISGAGVLFVLDLNTFSRTEGLAPVLEASSAPKVLIDHHLHPELDKFDLAFSCADASSTCELLYFILKALEGGNAAGIPPRSLYALMTGMTTDTNNFANSVTSRTLQMAGELLELGVDREDIIGNLYHSDRMERLEAFADILSKHLKVLPGGLSYILLTKEMMDSYGIEDGETETLVNIPLNVERIKVSIFARESDGVFRVSIRSKRGWSANKLATGYFHGGGHELAAGGKIFWPGDIENRDDAADFIESVAARFMQK